MAGEHEGATSTRGEGMKELLMLVGVLLTVVGATVVTAWIGAEAPEPSGAATSLAPRAAEAQMRPRVVVSAPGDLQVFHADVYFDVKSTRLRASAARLLQEKAALVSGPGAWAVMVQGYADSQGAAGYNRLLAERRADTVKRFLLELGVPETSVRVVTIGQEGALCDDPAPECQQLNRRVHLEIRKLPTAASPAAAVPVAAAGEATGNDAAPVASQVVDR